MRTQANKSKGGNARFSAIPRAEIPRSAFDRSHGHKTTFESGFLIPIYADEALPGDTISLSCNSFARMTTPLKPIMDQMYLDFFYFAVPLRILWDNFERFNGAQDNPGDSTDFLTPKMTSPTGGYLAGDLQDYLGLPTQFAGITHNSFHTRAYNLIWNEWFRDENMQDSVIVDLDDGPDTPSDYVLLKRGKRHDYFTSAMPFAQKGAAVRLPIGGSAPLGGIPNLIPTAAPTFEWAGAPTSGPLLAQGSGSTNVAHNPANAAATATLNWTSPGLTVDNSGVFVDLSAATGNTINAIRQAFQIQKLLERDARGGTRYTEIVRSHFGVISDDARLQRPEYLGGGSTRINVHPVAQTSTATSQPTPQGNLAAFVTGGGPSKGFKKSFTEHCVVLGFAMVRADLTYQQGLPRMFSRNTRFDFYWPAFAHLGEQEIKTKEIYADGSGSDETIFGYQERYAEYRYKPSQITGKFRSQDPLSLDVWHLAQDFPAAPALNDAFISEDPPIDRVVAVPSEPQFLFDSWFNITHVRPMPAYSVPGLIDHF
nr:MAG: major capsid protein [Microvirus sp.]